MARTKKILMSKQHFDEVMLKTKKKIKPAMAAIAYRCLVLGENQAMVARDFGITRSAAGQQCQRFKLYQAELTDKDVTVVKITVPTMLAEKVKKDAKLMLKRFRSYEQEQENKSISNS